MPTDGELDSLSRDDLVQEVVRLRSGIRRHRDGTGHELCWHHPQLWALLPESTDPVPDVPEWPQFLRPSGRSSCGAASAIASLSMTSFPPRLG